MKMSNLLHIITFIVLCTIVPLLQSCKQTETKEELAARQLEARQIRDIAGARLGGMLNKREFRRAFSYIDSLHRMYPNDPQLFFL